MRQMKNILVVLLLGIVMPSVVAQDTETQDRDALEQQMEAAEQQLEEATRKIAELSRALSKNEMVTIFSGLGERKPRAMLGVTIGEPRDTTTGVLVTGVSPAGPADRAGLKSDDLIVRLNDKSLADEPGKKAIRSLLDELAALQPGDVARVQIRRGDRQMTFEVVTEDLSAAMPGFQMQFKGNNWDSVGEMSAAMKDMHEKMDDAKMVIELHGLEALKDLPEKLESRLGTLNELPGLAMFGGPLLGPRLDLVPVSGDLGPYFGVDRGLLLTAAPEQNLGLKAGDIILSVDGEPVNSPREVRRYFLDADAGDVLSFGIVRQRESLDVDVTVPATSKMGDWTCTSSGDGGARKCVKNNGKAYQFRYSDKD